MEFLRMGIKIEHKCRSCGSTNIKKNGFNVSGSQQYYCRDCKASKVLEPKNRYTEEQKEKILKAYFERVSLRGLKRIYGVDRKTVKAWLRKKGENSHLEATLTASEEGDVLEVDEMWSYVGKKENPKWLWLAINRRNRHIVVYHLGDRKDIDCFHFYKKLPEAYKSLISYSDKWESYKKVFPYDKLRHECVDKSSGETNHIERFNLTVRQRLSRYVRKTLSFSKSDYWHDVVTKLFLIEYNLSLTFS